MNWNLVVLLFPRSVLGGIGAGIRQDACFISSNDCNTVLKLSIRYVLPGEEIPFNSLKFKFEPTPIDITVIPIDFIELATSSGRSLPLLAPSVTTKITLLTPEN
ncbi:hypothetical protein BpHYR1_048141 [Brachionus plicatilis]|uniref:Uncharacterized protein n=1 Tax=Brachionus plicatilis TaxID=10195 RepID=A0A3M7T087_BRAPC|nr:hypothetical protein BpHYR1_048141 [Brachionus plicatilis]